MAVRRRKLPVRSCSGPPHDDGGARSAPELRLVHDEVLAATDKQQELFTYASCRP